MAQASAEVVICGAGIAGVAAAYHLAVRRGVRGVVVVDERPPLTLTSDKSAECYRNWWPGPGDAMVALMNRSIDLMEELARASGNVFLMNRRGYLFATAQPEQVDRYMRAAEEAAAFGAGPVRVHRSSADTYQPAPAVGFEAQPDVRARRLVGELSGGHPEQSPDALLGRRDLARAGIHQPLPQSLGLMHVPALGLQGSAHEAPDLAFILDENGHGQRFSH